MYRLESIVKCSPNNYPWFNGFPEFKSDNPDHNLNRFPVCESFCLQFYTACENQQLCVDTDKGNYGFTRRSPAISCWISEMVLKSCQVNGIVQNTRCHALDRPHAPR